MNDRMLRTIATQTDGAFCTRREMLVQSGMGLGMFGLASLFREAQASTAQFENPLSPKPSHFPAKAKHIIHVFLNGGPSHVDTFDPKPILEKYAGKPLPNENLRTERKTGAAFPSPFKFKKYGQSGIDISDIFAPLGKHADDLCVIRSMHADVPNHEPSLMLMNCGDPTLPRPSVGSWITYGLGTENQNLPAFVVLCPRGYPIKDTENWQSAFLPGSYQGTYVDTQFTQVDKLIANIRNRTITSKEQRRQLDLIQAMNRLHAERRQNESALQARIQSFELAYRMQMEATDAFDTEREPKHIQEAYGFNTEARQLLIARRLVERGVRYVQVWHGQGQPWDSHDDLRERHADLAGQISKALSALLTDLKQRRLLDETLVICGGEFGRTPTVELPQKGANAGKINGRDHNHYGFTVWMAGGGAKGGYIHGATDECGFQAVEKKVHVHDLHATMLHLMGLDHKRLTYRFAGRDFRLTDVHGNIVHELLA